MSGKYIAAAVLSFAFLPAAYAACDVTVESNDAMQFNTKEIVVDKSCKEFTVNLKHVGKLPKASMGHNWVLTKDSDFQGAANEGVAAGAANDYVKPNDARVIAHTKLIGGGEADSVTFDVSKLEAGQGYTFFCSFPGHWAIMKGSLKLGS
ncbi:azurin [Paracandidimonas soli]|uniref:Azurin n=1 Tax=Paracandidimonas soli TaxID=1917182 RepID=A0A4R3V5T2_9BURK|nr:azurin [Paracandidimonas soli]TCU99170.1 azurin [Paracandidimonas soli]